MNTVSAMSVEFLAAESEYRRRMLTTSRTRRPRRSRRFVR
jgi:hypothetical protein